MALGRSKVQPRFEDPRVLLGQRLRGIYLLLADHGGVMFGDDYFADLYKFYLQSCWKLCRAYGVCNIAVAHRLSDLRSQADDGTATAKVAMGLLADTQTRVCFRQSPSQIAEATELLGLSTVAADLLPQLPRGAALWRVGETDALVRHVIGVGPETSICDTDRQLQV